MDVHPPHQPVRGWKDFALHLLTITVGLFIALTLEAAVESLHHRHLVRDARQNATVYTQQEYVNKTAIAIINEESRAGAALDVATDPSKLTAAEIESLLIRSAEIDLSFGTLQSTMQQLDDMYTRALKGS